MPGAPTLARVAFLSWLIRRWWFWIAVVPLLLVLAAALTIRWSGQLAWRREQAAARADGLMVSFPELVASAPVVDVARQERLWQWLQRVESYSDPSHGTTFQMSRLGCWDHPATASDFVSPTEWTDHPEVRSRDLTELSELLDSGPVHWGQLGWIRQDVPYPERATLAQARQIRHGEIEAVGFALAGYGAAALAGHDPAALRHVDLMLAAGRSQTDFHESISYLGAASFRDALYVRMIAEGRLDAATSRTWLGEPAVEARVMIDLLQAERVAVALLAEGGADETKMSGAAWYSWQSCASQVTDALFLSHLLAAQSRWYRNSISTLRGHPVPPGPAFRDAPEWLRQQSIAELMVSDNAMNGVPWFISRLHGHRVDRALAQAILAWRAGALPQNGTQAQALLGSYLQAVPGLLPPLQYERLSATRFRIAIDPRGDLPVFAQRGDVVGHSDFAQPPATAMVVEREWSLEFDCAVLAPGGAADPLSAQDRALPHPDPH